MTSENNSPPVGAVRMRHREGHRGGVSWRGDHYEADADGIVIVPHAAVGDLMAHQMEMAPEGPAKIDAALDQLSEGVAAEGEKVEALIEEAHNEAKADKAETRGKASKE